MSIAGSTVLVSLVVPVFNEENSIGLFLERADAVFYSCREQFPGLAFEFVFVNDGSRDATLSRLTDFAALDQRITILDLSRNFGKEAALSAGIDAARGLAVIPIDVDLQDPPELIPVMIQKWLEGSEVVLACRSDRSQDTFTKRFSANVFYRFHNAISRTQIPYNVGDYRLIDRAVVDSLKSLPENRRFMKGLFAWVGFRTTTVNYTRAARSADGTKFSPLKLWNLAIEGITSFSTAPLVVWTYIGFAVAFMAFLFGIIIITQQIIFGVRIPGYATLASGVFFLGGIQLMGIGIVGEYVGRVYSEVKHRPVYIVRKVIRGTDGQQLLQNTR